MSWFIEQIAAIIAVIFVTSIFFFLMILFTLGILAFFKWKNKKNHR